VVGAVKELVSSRADVREDSIPITRPSIKEVTLTKKMEYACA
jgi:hypothetical protein